MARAVVAAIWLLGLLTVFSVVVELNDVTRTAGPVAVIPFRLHGSMIVEVRGSSLHSWCSSFT